jgi:hypothetical protein
MNAFHVCKWYAIIALVALGSSFGLSKALFAQPAPANAEEGVQVLTRGPVHEAFAETVTYNPEPGVVVAKSPPAAIEEVPPEQRLEGANVAWIPGYWAWDDERSDFLWVSGIWRALPPGRQWVPGYWGKVAQGFQWISGYWSDAKVEQVEYLPEPPATVEIGPNVAAPSADDIWLPGCWVWQSGRYAWRPGFWAPAQPNWVWMPAHYVWAPRGYVFVDGYWDYSIDRRGVLFAPVYFSASVYGRPGFSYSPTTVIDLGVFTSHLFLRPRYQHYYFGDYYAANYSGAGFFPWFSFQANHFGYDPLYTHDRWQHRHDRGWAGRLEADFQNRRNHENLRPARLWDGQRGVGARGLQPGGTNPVLAMPLNDYRKNKNSPLRFQPVNPSERTQFTQHAKDVQRFREERQKLETNTAGAPVDTHAPGFAPGKVKLPGSPIVGPPAVNLDKGQTLPKRLDAPKVDTRVQPTPNEIFDRWGTAKQKTQQPQQRTVNRVPLDQPGTQPQAPPKVERSPQQQPRKVERAPQQPPPAAERRAPQQPPPAAERRAPQQPPPAAERRAPQQPPPAAERRAPQQPPPAAERRAPQQPPPAAERRAPQQPPPAAERRAPQPPPKESAGPSQDDSKGKGKK